MTKPTRLSRILIVEPDFGQQDKLMNELRNEGYEVMGVGTAREALDYVKR